MSTNQTWVEGGLGDTSGRARFNPRTTARSPLSGKRLGVFGSSTSDEARIGAGIYYRVIANRTGLVIVSQALQSTKLTPATADYTLDGSRNMLRQIDALPSDLDFVVGMPGANDERDSTALGAFGTTVTWDFYSSLHKMCQMMIDKWHGKPLGIMASQYMGSPTAGTVVTLQSSAYHDAIAEVCRYYGIPVLDLAKEGGVPYSYLPAKNLYVQSDGLHLNNAGNLKMSYRVEAFYKEVLGAELPSSDAVPAPIVNSVSDSFTRAADNTTAGVSNSGHVWTSLQGVWGIGTNALRMVTRSSTSSGSGARDVVVIDSGLKDATISGKQLTLTSPSGIAFRVTDALNFMMFVRTSTTYTLYRVVAGTSTSLGAITMAGAAGDLLSVTCNGDNITATINGANPITATDSFNNTATKHGFVCRGYEGIDLFDDFNITQAV